MARRTFRGPALRQGQRRLTEWGASADVSTTSGLLAGSVVLDQSFTNAILNAAGLFPSTIVRVRGDLWVRSDQNAANETPFGAMAFAVANENARAAGVASLLAPIADEGADAFFVYQYFHGGNFGASTGALFANPWHHFPFDSKAMRKLEDGDSIVIMMENSDGAGGADYVLKFRILFKVH